MLAGMQRAQDSEARCAAHCAAAGGAHPSGEDGVVEKRMGNGACGSYEWHPGMHAARKAPHAVRGGAATVRACCPRGRHAAMSSPPPPRACLQSAMRPAERIRRIMHVLTSRAGLARLQGAAAQAFGLRLAHGTTLLQASMTRCLLLLIYCLCVCGGGA